MLILLSALSVSAVFAETPVTSSCSLLDESGNPICAGSPSVGQANGTGQGVNADIARIFTGVLGSAGGLKGNAEELLKISSSGIIASINQTRQAGNRSGANGSDTGAGPEFDSHGGKRGYRDYGPDGRTGWDCWDRVKRQY